MKKKTNQPSKVLATLSRRLKQMAQMNENNHMKLISIHRILVCKYSMNISFDSVLV